MEDAARIITAIAAQLERAASLSHVAEQLSAELATLRGVGSSDDEEATVTVDHQGIVIDVALSDAISGADGQTVSGWVLSATSRAIEDVQRRAEPVRAAILQPHLGTPWRDDLNAKIDDLYSRIEEAERVAGKSGAADEEEDR